MQKNHKSFSVASTTLRSYLNFCTLIDWCIFYPYLIFIHLFLISLKEHEAPNLSVLLQAFGHVLSRLGTAFGSRKLWQMWQPPMSKSTRIKIVDNRFKRSLNRITLVSLSSASKVYFHNPV
jgi:hypothetical protein